MSRNQSTFYRLGLNKLVLGVTLATVATAANAQWNVNIIQSWDYNYSTGINASGQFGSVSQGQDPHAASWQGTSASLVDLNPAGKDFSAINGANGSKQVGYAGSSNTGIRVAGLWSGTAASFTGLNPAGALGSVANGLSGNTQVGSATIDMAGHYHAGLWSGTASSWVDLNPVGKKSSSANAVSGGTQVGFADGHAGLWNGTAASWIDLNPAGKSSSIATGVSGNTQVGSATVDFANHSHAGMWTGSAASWVDLNPAGATSSGAAGIYGNYEFGEATIGGLGHAGFWSGSAGSWIDLDDSLKDIAPWFGGTTATGMWVDGNTTYVIGNADDGTDSAIVIWSHINAVPEPATMTMLGLGALAFVRKKRSKK